MVLSTMNAMVVEVPENGSKPELIRKQISPPMLEPHEVLVKVATVAQNPTDGKSPRASNQLRITDSFKSKLLISVSLGTALCLVVTSLVKSSVLARMSQRLLRAIQLLVSFGVVS